jgi:hypothetical protein
VSTPAVFRRPEPVRSVKVSLFIPSDVVVALVAVRALVLISDDMRVVRLARVDASFEVKKLVVVAEVPVAVVKVRDWRVDEPVARRLEAVRVPVRV